MSKIRNCIESNKWVKSDPLKPYYQIRNELSLKDSVVLKGNKLVIPFTLQKRLLKLAHESHSGVVKTKQLLRENVWWLRIDEHVADMIKACHACQMTSIAPREPPVIMTKLPDGPWRELAMDITGPFEDSYYLLVVIDYYSRFPMVEILKSITSQSIINQLRKWFAIFGLSSVIKTENEANFVSDEFEDFLNQNGIKHSRSLPYRARQNGLVENFNKSIKKYVKTAVAEYKNWRQELQTFLLYYRATKYCTTNKSPCELLMHRAIKTKLPENQVHSTPRSLQLRDKQRKAKMQFYANKSKPKNYRKYSVGQSVLILRQEKGKILHNWSNKICKVVEQKGISPKLKGESGEVLYRSVNHVRPYYCSANIVRKTPKKK